ncbi:hypothetical protein CcCBS67573_g06448 [Chytriomyces confervae]|uniref:Alpha 1,4-glycosyltransferase domain-containing protein n=1 Tax=Chytriomyces confervae TaxID=246404 RepID=A0A507F3B3_9FUNG|nr:hypothetical protein CcCBS67573_g06448 [Chytriomyces confervae]
MKLTITSTPSFGGRSFRRLFVWTCLLTFIAFSSYHTFKRVRIKQVSDKDAFPMDTVNATFMHAPHIMAETALSQSCAAFQNEVSTAYWRRVEQMNTTQPPAKLPDNVSEKPLEIVFINHVGRSMDPVNLCALESAARHNPTLKITLHSKDATRLQIRMQTWRNRINFMYNSNQQFGEDRIEFVESNFTAAFDGTILAPWYAELLEMNSTLFEAQSTNLMAAYQLAVMWKNGGVFPNAKFVSVNPLPPLAERIIAFQSYSGEKYFGDSFLSLRPRDALIWIMMKKFLDAFRYKRNTPGWHYQLGPSLNWAIHSYCSETSPPAVLCTFDPRSGEVLFSFDDAFAAKTKPWTDMCPALNKLVNTAVGLTLNKPIFVESAWNTLMDINCPVVVSSFAPKALGFYDGEGCATFEQRAQTPGTTFLTASGEEISESQASLLASNIPKRINFLLFNDHFKNLRYLCSIESAARQNPNHDIFVYAKNAPDFLKESVNWFLHAEKRNPGLRNQLHILDLDWDDLFRGTPLESWWRRGTWMQSRWPDQNLGNAARLAILWKEGGVYLDMDIISLNPVSGMGRSLAWQLRPNILNNAYFSLEKGDEFAWRMMENFVSGFNGTIWGRNGPRMVERTHVRYCRPNLALRLLNRLTGNLSQKMCDFNIAPSERLYPIAFNHKKSFLKPARGSCDLLKTMSERSIGIHWWNKGLKGTNVGVGSVLETVMKNHCPAMFDAYYPEEIGFFSEDAIRTGKAKFWRGYEKNDGF